MCKVHKAPEVWQPVPGYEGYYDVSNRGRVRRLPIYITRVDGYRRFFRERVLRPCTTEFGYRQVQLYRDCRGKGFTIHRLVLLAFKGPPGKGQECRHHPDPTPSHNCVENLKWGTSTENTNDAIKQGRFKFLKPRRGRENNNCKTSARTVLKIKRLLKIKMTGVPKRGGRVKIMQEIARETNTTYNIVAEIRLLI
jgi:hypothetical protein